MRVYVDAANKGDDFKLALSNFTEGLRTWWGPEGKKTRLLKQLREEVECPPTVTHRHAPSRIVTHRHAPSRSVTHRHAPSRTVTHRCSPLRTVAHRCAPLRTVAHRHTPLHTDTHR